MIKLGRIDMIYRQVKIGIQKGCAK